MTWTWPGVRDEARHFHHSSAPSTPPPAPSTAPTSAFTQTPEQKRRGVKTQHFTGPGGSSEVPETTPEPLGGISPYYLAASAGPTKAKKLGDA